MSTVRASISTWQSRLDTLKSMLRSTPGSKWNLSYAWHTKPKLVLVHGHLGSGMSDVVSRFWVFNERTKGFCLPQPVSRRVRV